jgi:hypothetical protein
MQDLTGKQKIRVQITLDVNIAPGEFPQDIVQEMDYEVSLGKSLKSELLGTAVTDFYLVDKDHPEV